MDKIKTGIWKRKSKKGIDYLSGVLKLNDNKYSIALFVNDNKISSKSPDYTMYVEEIDKKDAQLSDDSISSTDDESFLD